MKRREFLQGAAAAAIVPAFGLLPASQKAERPVSPLAPDRTAPSAPRLPSPGGGPTQWPQPLRRIKEHGGAIVYLVNTAIDSSNPPANLHTLQTMGRSLCGTAQSVTLDWRREYSQLCDSATGHTFYVPGRPENAVHLRNCHGLRDPQLATFLDLINVRSTLLLECYSLKTRTLCAYLLYGCALAGASSRFCDERTLFNAQLHFANSIRYVWPIGRQAADVLPQYVDDSDAYELCG